MMWRILLSSASSAQWYIISNMYAGAYGQLMLEDNQFYLVTYKLGSYVAYFSKVIDKYNIIWMFNNIYLYYFNFIKCYYLNAIGCFSLILKNK